MGNDGTSQSKFSKYIDFSLKINKICYLPGEIISGTLYLIGKPGLIETQLNEPKASFKIEEEQKWNYSSNHTNYSAYRNSILYENNISFDSFIGSNLLIGVSIPFSIPLPTIAYPTCSFKHFRYGGYVRHLLIVEFAHLKLKRILSIVVKNNPKFTTENKILRIPFTFSQQKSKSKFLTNKGNYIININLPKNVFYYDEPIPIEIIIDCKNLNLIINKIKLAIIRNKRFNCKSNANIIRDETSEIIFCKYKPLNINLKEQIIKDKLFFPKYYKLDKFIYPPTVYQSFENNEKNFPKISLNNPGQDINRFNYNYFIAPSCLGGLLSVNYYLEIKLKFDTTFTFDEHIYLPIDFCSRPDEMEISQIKLGKNLGKFDFNAPLISNNISNSYNPNMQIGGLFDKPQENENSENKSEFNDKITFESNSNNSSPQKNDIIDINRISDDDPPPPFFNDDENLKTI